MELGTIPFGRLVFSPTVELSGLVGVVEGSTLAVTGLVATTLCAAT